VRLSADVALSESTRCSNRGEIEESLYSERSAQDVILGTSNPIDAPCCPFIFLPISGPYLGSINLGGWFCRPASLCHTRRESVDARLGVSCGIMTSRRMSTGPEQSL
jgi:hypothetical protein